MAADTRPLVLFFGCARRGEYETLLEAGFSLGLLRDTASPKSGHVPEGLAHLDELAFTVGADALTARVEAIRRTRPLACVIALLERHISLAAEVCARLGLSGLAVETAGAVRDKTLMHERLVARLGPGCTARYNAVAGTEDALAFAARARYPVVLKPQRLHSSICVTLCRDTDELTAAVAMLQAAVPRFAENEGPRARLHIEEFIAGSNHSVDVVSLKGDAWPTPVVDVITGADLGDDDFHHYARITPSALSAADQQALAELAVDAAVALGIEPGIAHVELVLSPLGPRVLEVAGRPGGNRHRLLALARGLDLCRAHVDVLRSRRPTLRSTRNVPAAIATPYPTRTGVLRNFRCLEDVYALPSVRSVEARVAAGAVIGSPRDGASPSLYVALLGRSRAALMEDLDRLAAMRDRLFDLEPSAAAPEITTSAESR